MIQEITRDPAPHHRIPDGFLPRAALVILGFSSGISAFFHGFYDATVWQPILLGLLTVGVALFMARPALPKGSAIVAISGLAGLWLWSLLSSTWAEAADLAVTDAGRWLLYAVLLALLLGLAASPEKRRLLIGATTAGVLTVASYLLIRFLWGGASDFFVGNRLNEPLDYINGVASYLILGFWPLMAVAERVRHPALRGLSVFAAIQLISVAALTQSRGGTLALVLSAALVLAVVPGRLRRAWLLLIIAAGVAFAVPAIQEITGNAAAAPSTDQLRTFALASLAGGAMAGLLWALVGILATAAGRRSDDLVRTLRRVSLGGMAVIAVVIAAVAVVPLGQRIDQIQSQYDTFTSLQPTDTGSRLVSGGGNRYDYWRIAAGQLRDHPVKGVGAGNYASTYYLERQSSEDIQQAHSIELQALGELGLIGGAALAAFLAAVFVGFWKTAHGANPSRGDPALAVAAGGAFFAWVFQTSVDWMHLIPGLTAIAICAAAVLLPSLRPLPKPLPAPAIALVVVIAALAAYPVANQMLALRLQSSAEEQLQTDPIAAVADAKDSIALQPAQQTYYLESAAYARLSLYAPARRSLLTATRRAPHDFVAWALLGDLATRRGLEEQARSSYRRASKLNPRDPGLAGLARGETPRP